jgi:transcriptional regulator with XRE-family HTH domain
MLASLSVTYYTFLEQGRPVRPSEQVLDALASALRMSAAERRYLHVRDWWPRHDVAAIGGSGSKKLRHPRLGPVEYTHAILQVADNPDYTLVTYSPAIPPGSGPLES